MKFGFFIAILAIIGIAVGTAAPLWAQTLALLVYGMYMMTEKVRRMEMDWLIPFFYGLAFFIGVIIGDISYLIQTDFISLKGIPNPFIVN